MLYLNHWHLLEIWHSERFCGARCIFCTHFGREKVHFWGCPDRPLLQDISIINVIWWYWNIEFGAGILGTPASGRQSHKGHRGGREKSVAPYLLRVPARFLLSALLPIYTRQFKFEWGQSMSWFIFGILFPLWHRGAFSNCAFPFSPWPPTHTRVNLPGAFFLPFFCAQISPQPLHLFPTLQHLLK